ncbi:hypothetical protein ES703_89313 [subsurface metagenome]
MTKSNKYWTLLIIFLIVIIVIGSLVTWSRYRPSQPIEISLSPSQELQGEIYIGGAVSNPGFYPLKSGDAIDDIIWAAGGTITEADLNHLKLYISKVGEVEPAQKVNLNRAEAWLLQALPGIGEVRAQAIIDYRQQNGRFGNINELIKVEGIGTATYEGIEYLITVAN